ncbi:hypothetical protein ASC99_26175 [Kitasatospora sp. Root107]|nr:zinc-binding dehydrogenase [Kitasatospora sp. Root107]KQV17109.1 hypothetical protein ASC99_26175 [Kitasatospora sp. Root107]
MLEGVAVQHDQVRALADLDILKGLIEAGTLIPALDRTYPLAEVPDAIAHLMASQARGKLVIQVRED